MKRRIDPCFVFIACSSGQSLDAAQALRQFLKSVIQKPRVFVFANDISAGRVWFDVVHEQLQAAKIGVVCVTPQNVKSPWIYFEAGAISIVAGDVHRVVPLLFDMKPEDVPSPFTLFSSIQPTRQGILKLVESINEVWMEEYGEPALEQSVLVNSFNAHWEGFAKELQDIAKPGKAVVRSDREILLEVLSQVRMFGSADTGRATFSRGYGSLWRLIEERALAEGLTFELDGRKGRADIVVGDSLAIETNRFDDEVLPTTCRALVDKVVRSIAVLHLVAGVVLVANEPDEDFLLLQQYAAEKRVGLIYFTEGRLLGTALARQVAPWLVDDEIDLVSV